MKFSIQLAIIIGIPSGITAIWCGLCFITRQILIKSKSSSWRSWFTKFWSSCAILMYYFYTLVINSSCFLYVSFQKHLISLEFNLTRIPVYWGCEKLFFIMLNFLILIVILVTQPKTKVGEVMSSPAITLSPRKTVKGNVSYKSGVSNRSTRWYKNQED